MDTPHSVTARIILEVRDEQGLHTFTGEATRAGSAPSVVDEALAAARRDVDFERIRRPGCTCTVDTRASERCNNTMLRCQGAVAAHLAAAGPVAAVEVAGPRRDETSIDHECG